MHAKFIALVVAALRVEVDRSHGSERIATLTGILDVDDLGAEKG